MKEENFESYSIEDDEEEGRTVKRLTMWSLMPRIMSAPSSGWQRTLEKGPSADIAVIRFLLPMALLSGGSDFFSLLYSVQASLEGVLVSGVISFCSFFLGYYMALVFAKVFLPKEDKGFPNTNYGRLLTMAGVATLAIFHILFKALPMFDFIIEFFPLWTIFLIYRGMKIAELRSDKSTFVLGVMCMVIICSPVLVEWVLSLFV